MDDYGVDEALTSWANKLRLVRFENTTSHARY
jgi:hypothetical protein